MAKPYNICKVCGTRRFLNFAGLCTKCNKNASREIVDNALGKKHDMQESKAAEMKAEMEALQAEELEEKQALEETDELTSEQKEVEEEGKKTDEETKEEKPDEK